MKHWTENDFHEWLYGLKEKDLHAGECPQCSAEFERLTGERQRILGEPQVPEQFLAEQRRRIYDRMQQRTRNWAPLKWAVSIAMLLVVAAGLTLSRPKKATVSLTTDDPLFSDIARIEQSEEPKAIQPLHKLFEE